MKDGLIIIEISVMVDSKGQFLKSIFKKLESRLFDLKIPWKWA